MVWDAAVVSSLGKAPIRAFINLPLCLTTKFFRYTSFGVLQIDRSAMWRWSSRLGSSDILTKLRTNFSDMLCIQSIEC